MTQTKAWTGECGSEPTKPKPWERGEICGGNLWMLEPTKECPICAAQVDENCGRNLNYQEKMGTADGRPIETAPQENMLLRLSEILNEGLDVRQPASFKDALIIVEASANRKFWEMVGAAPGCADYNALNQCFDALEELAKEMRAFQSSAGTKETRIWSENRNLAT